MLQSSVQLVKSFRTMIAYDTYRMNQWVFDRKINVDLGDKSSRVALLRRRMSDEPTEGFQYNPSIIKPNDY